MKVYKFILLICSVSYLNSSYCQEDDKHDIVKIIPPSPNAASLSRFIDFPVGLYTGTPDINIPLWEIQTRDLNLPISLSYHPSGVKVEEIPGWVGSNWGLIAGGIITRTVRGKPDDLPGGYYTSFGNDIPTYDDIIQAPDPNEFIQSWIDSQGTSYWIDVLEGQKDTEPDIYYFNFNGKSGKFFFDNNRNILLESHDYIYVQPEGNSNIQKWTIIDENGIQYIFGKDDSEGLDGLEKTICEIGPINIDMYGSTYNLIQINSPNGDKIEFEYDQVIIGYDLRINEKRSYNCNGGLWDYDYYYNNTTNISKQLSKITFNNGYIDFKALTSRLDLVGNNSLDEIIIYNNLNEKIKKYLLQYSYNSNRFFLEEIIEEGIDTPLYKFEYYEKDLLPSRLSKAQDHWGYYNGAAANNSLIPTFQTSCIEIPGANREPEADKMKYGTLKKIYYRTGGYTEFFYEPHDYGFFGNTKIDYEIIQPKYDEVSATCDQGACVGNINTKPFIIDHPQTVKIIYNCTNTVVPEGAGGDKVDIKKNGISIFDYPIGGGVSGTIWKELEPATYVMEAEATMIGDQATISVNYNIILGYNEKSIAGGLRIKKKIIHDGNSHEKDIITEYIYTMKDEPERSSGILLTRPIYFQIKELYQSTNSGFKFTDNYKRYGPIELWVIHSNSQVMLGTTLGSPVGYKFVDVVQNGKTINEYISAYDYPDDYQSNYWPYPPSQNYDWQRGLVKESEVLNEQNNRVAFNDYTYNSEELEKTVGLRVGCKLENLFNYDITILPNNIIIVPYFIQSGWKYLKELNERTYLEDGQTYINEKSLYFYDNNKHAQITRKSKKTSDNKLLTTQILYPDDYIIEDDDGFIDQLTDAHIIRPIETITYLSDASGGNVKILSGEINTYKTGIYKGKLDKNFVLETNIPISKSSFKLSNKTGTNALLPNEGTNTTFSIDNIDSHYPDEPEVTNDKYDNYGNLLQYHCKDDINISYIWGYKNTYPVAKIVGIDYNTAYNKLTDADKSILNNSPTDQQVRDIIKKIRDYYKNSNVMVYTYTYKPLVGMTSETDENGKTNYYYEYDSFGRLKYIRDLDQVIIQEYKYHYKE